MRNESVFAKCTFHSHRLFPQKRTQSKNNTKSCTALKKNILADLLSNENSLMIATYNNYNLLQETNKK